MNKHDQHSAVGLALLFHIAMISGLACLPAVTPSFAPIHSNHVLSVQLMSTVRPSAVQPNVVQPSAAQPGKTPQTPPPAPQPAPALAKAATTPLRQPVLATPAALQPIPAPPPAPGRATNTPVQPVNPTLPAKVPSTDATPTHPTSAHATPADTTQVRQTTSNTSANNADLVLLCHHRPAPVYPATARRLRESGQVVVKVWLDAQGEVSKTQLAQSSGFARLDRAALNTVQRWRCKAPTQQGQQVPAVALQQFQFVLDR